MSLHVDQAPICPLINAWNVLSNATNVLMRLIVLHVLETTICWSLTIVASLTVPICTIRRILNKLAIAVFLPVRPALTKIYVPPAKVVIICYQGNVY